MHGEAVDEERGRDSSRPLGLVSPPHRHGEVVVVDLVRSNERGEIGFLGDERRMNVALTRAKRLLIVVGDGATIGEHPYYRAFLDAAMEGGFYRSVWEDAAP